MELETNPIEGQIAAEMMNKKEIPLPKLQRESELLNKHESVLVGSYSMASEKAVENENVTDSLFGDPTELVSQVSVLHWELKTKLAIGLPDLASRFSVLHWELKTTNNWLNSKVKSGTVLTLMMNDSKCPNKMSNAYASARRLTMEPVTFDHYSFEKISGVKKTILVYQLDKTFFPSTNPIQEATFPNFQVNLLTSLPAMGLKLLDLILNFSGDSQKWSEWCGQFMSTVGGTAVGDNVKMK